MAPKEICEICGEPQHAKGLCRNCYEHKLRDENPEKYKADHAAWNAAWRNRNPDKVKAAEAKTARVRTCRIIKRHEAEMSDDPEALTTEFIKNMIGIECE